MIEQLTDCQLADYEIWLRQQEKSIGTIKKYVRDIRQFQWWCSKRDKENVLSAELIAQWREWLQNSGYASVTVNSMIGAMNSFLHFLGRDDCRAKYLRIQHRLFREESRQLGKRDYEILRETAEKEGRHRLAMVMETICSTGIRVSELRYITVEAIRCGQAELIMKGKIRTILIPLRLAKKLLKYAKKEEIHSGEIFRSRSGRSLSRKLIWAEMKALCNQAGIAPTKVFPHNLRHLFAVTFYKLHRDIVRLADVLGHSSMETTRIYLLTPEKEHMRQLDELGLII